MDTVSNIINTPFLDEPAWRWFIAFGAMLFFLGAWKDIIDWIK